MVLLKKTVWDTLVAKVNNIDISGFVLKTKYDTDKSYSEKKISDIEKKIPDTSGLVKKTDYNAKVTEIESKIPSISGLATISTLTAVENKIPDESNLVKNADYETKTTEVEKNVTNHNHDKYITASEFNMVTAEIFAASIAQANSVTKTDFDHKLITLNKNVTK